MSTANPKITVATVTYNAVDVIERTLESVEEQDYPHVEHIIVDGHSHDGTIEAVMHYQERGSREGHPHEIAAISDAAAAPRMPTPMPIAAIELAIAAPACEPCPSA